MIFPLNKGIRIVEIAVTCRTFNVRCTSCAEQIVVAAWVAMIDYPRRTRSVHISSGQTNSVATIWSESSKNQLEGKLDVSVPRLCC
jgi:hypothetical protein